MPAELTRSFLEKVVRSSGWALSEVESLSLEGENISCLGDSFAGVGRLVYLSLARNNITSLLGVEHLPSLSTAVLRANRVSSMSEVGRLAQLPNLRNLDLRLNPIMAAPVIGGGGSSGSGSGRNVGVGLGDGGGGGGGRRNHGGYSQRDATAADVAWGRQEPTDFLFTRNPREMVLKALPQLVNLDGQKVEESERQELRRRRLLAVATPAATSADRREEEFSSAGELRPVERRREEETVGRLNRSSRPHHDSEISYDATGPVVTAAQDSAGGERARLGFEREVVGASRSYDERDLRRVGTAPSRGWDASPYPDTGARKRDRTGVGVFDEGTPALRTGRSGSGSIRAVDEVVRSQQRPVRMAAGSQGKGIPPGAAASTADDDDLAALWSELGEGFLEFQQPRAASAATAAGRGVSPRRPQHVPGCRRCGCSGNACECRDPLHSPTRISVHTQLFAAELDGSSTAVSLPGVSRQTRYEPRTVEPRLLSDSGVTTKEWALRQKGRGDGGGRPTETRSTADDEWGTVDGFDGDCKISEGGRGGDDSFRRSSGNSRDDTNPPLVVTSGLVSTARRRGSGSHGGYQETADHVPRSPGAFSGRQGISDAVIVAEAKPVANLASTKNGGGEQREPKDRRHPPAETVSPRHVVGRQNPRSAAAPGSLPEPPLPPSQPVQAVPTEDAASTVAVTHCTHPGQSGSSSSSTTTAAARAVEAFRRSSQRLGLVDASKTGSSSPANYRDGGGVAADECLGSLRGGSADVGSIDGGSPGLASSVEVTAELDTRARYASVGDGKASEHSRGTDSTGEPSALRGLSSTGTTANAAPETSTALVLPPDTVTAVTSDTVVPSGKAVSFLTGGVVTCQECVANFGKYCDKDSRATADSGVPAAGGGSELHERWWAREREFTSRWAERERDFDARWAAREREFDKRRREESKEFTRGMRAMLFEAHNALIASNAWLLTRLQAVESVRAPPPQAGEPDTNISATQPGESTLKDVGTAATIASKAGLRHPLPAQPAGRRFVSDTSSPTPLAEAERERQQGRQRKHGVLLGGEPVRGAPSHLGDDGHTPGGATVTRDRGLPAVVTERVGAGTLVDAGAGGERGTGGGRGGTGGRISRAPRALEEWGDRGQRGEADRVYRGGGAFQQGGGTRNSRPLVSDIDAAAATLPRPRTAASAPREGRELPSEASELPTRSATSSGVGACYPAAAVAGGRGDPPPPRESATGRHSEGGYFDAEGGSTGLKDVVSVGGAVGMGRRSEQKVGESAVAIAASSTNIAKIEASSASTAPAALGSNSSGSYSGGAEGGTGGEANDRVRIAPANRGSNVGGDRRADRSGSAEQVSAFASAHASVPAESESGIAPLGEDYAIRVLGGEPAEPADTGGQTGAIVGAGVRVGVSSGGNGGMIVWGQNSTLPPSEEINKRDTVWRRDKGGRGSGAMCPDPEVTTSAPDG